MNKIFLVRVSCMTFNHAPYIEDAMNGFCMQETTFPFVCTIMDDASTDGEPEVIKKYLLEHFDLDNKNVVRNEETDDYVMTFAQHKTNKNCYFAVYFLKYNHYSIKKTKIPYIQEWQDQVKYIAICEGDDYWIIPNKLQIQVDYLNNNANVGLVWSDIHRYYEVDNKWENNYFETKKFPIRNSHDDFIMNAWFLAPCTWMYRVELGNNLVQVNRKKCFTGDLYILLTLSKYMDVSYIDKVSSVYRVLPNSASHIDDFYNLYGFLRKIKNLRISFARNKSLLFRMKLWRRISFCERMAFRKEPTYIFVWTRDAIRDFIYLLLGISC